MATTLTGVTISPGQVSERGEVPPSALEERVNELLELLRSIEGTVADADRHRGRDRTECSCEYCKEIREAAESALVARHEAIVNAILTDSGFADLWAEEARKNQFSFETDWVLAPLVSGNNYAATHAVFEERFQMAFESTHANMFRDFFKMCRDNNADKCVDALMDRYPRLVRRLVAHFDALEDRRRNAEVIDSQLAKITTTIPEEIRVAPGFCICVSCMWRYPQYLSEEDRDFIRTRANVQHKRRL
jgi:hypothetical protein